MTFMIIHVQGYKYPKVRFNETKVWGLGNRTYRYTIGLERANYPMPAVRVVVIMDDMGTAIYQETANAEWLNDWDTVLECFA